MKPVEINPANDAMFFETIQGEDMLGVVVKGLMHIEAELAALIEENSRNPAPLSKDIEYSMRVRIAVSMGLRETLLSPLAALGGLRNKLAHDLKATVDKSVANNFYKSLDKIDTETIQKVYRELTAGNDVFPKRLADADPLDQIRLYLVAMRSAIRAARIQSEKSRSRIGHALQLLEATGL